MPITLKRAYEKASQRNGKRILVERLWPRGLRKEAAIIDEWLRDLAPSTQLRKWFGHEPSKWAEFKRRYWKELDAKPNVVAKLAKECSSHKVTFVFAARDEKFNNAVALKEYIESRVESTAN